MKSYKGVAGKHKPEEIAQGFVFPGVNRGKKKEWRLFRRLEEKLNRNKQKVKR